MSNSLPPTDPPEASNAAGAGCMTRIVRGLPFSPPFRVITEYRDGTDAHIIDAAGNIIIESSTWVSDPCRRHKKAMLLICDALNDKFQANA
jgi:hypothetical protein